MTTTYLLAMLIAAIASIVIQACSGGSGNADSRCSTATQAFEAAPSDVTAQAVRHACHME